MATVWNWIHDWWQEWFVYKAELRDADLDGTIMDDHILIWFYDLLAGMQDGRFPSVLCFRLQSPRNVFDKDGNIINSFSNEAHYRRLIGIAKRMAEVNLLPSKATLTGIIPCKTKGERFLIKVIVDPLDTGMWLEKIKEEI